MTLAELVHGVLFVGSTVGAVLSAWHGAGWAALGLAYMAYDLWEGAQG